MNAKSIALLLQAYIVAQKTTSGLITAFHEIAWLARHLNAPLEVAQLMKPKLTIQPGSTGQLKQAVVLEPGMARRSLVTIQKMAAVDDWRVPGDT